MPSVAFVINRTLIRDLPGFLRRCQAAARAHGWEPTFAETSPAEAGLGLARQAVAAGARLVFAAGGDGTVRACAQALAGTGIPLAIVPLGTANLTARALRIPSRTERALEAGFGGRDRQIDLARADGDGIDGDRLDGSGAGGGGIDGLDGDDAGGISFTAMAGIGLDAAVVGTARAPHKRRLGWLAYAAAGLTQLGWTPRDFTVRPGRRRAGDQASAVRGGGERRPAARGLLAAARGQVR